MSSTKFGGLALFSAGVISTMFFVIQFAAYNPHNILFFIAWSKSFKDVVFPLPILIKNDDFFILLKKE